MKIILSILIAISLQAGNPIVDGSKEWEKFFNGNKNDALGYGIYIGYVAGVRDSIDGVLFCIPKDVDSDQILAIVRKYIKNNPEKWNKGNWNLVVTPLKEAFSCKKKK